ncbi:hypothetical protein BAE44_0001566 [Dichanthelium oligosanthes]|uniref:Uncharacterized protein n=1 Tax=Dichanthelium oligosanthes TaxID=888268 RepID=A0A1E5WJ35_9POAL|nr:hypothetical protein BAE44_0001566 [Dichanthelium oligosanthes]
MVPATILMFVAGIIKYAARREPASPSTSSRGSRETRDRQEVTRLALAPDKTLEEQAYDLFALFQCACYDINLGHRERKISQAFFLDRTDMDPRHVPPEAALAAASVGTGEDKQ